VTKSAADDCTTLHVHMSKMATKEVEEFVEENSYLELFKDDNGKEKVRNKSKHIFTL